MRLVVSLVPRVCLLLALTAAAAAVEPRAVKPTLRGAAHVLRQIQEARGARAAAEPEAKSLREQLQEDLDAFATSSSALAPDLAASGWLALHQRYMDASESLLQSMTGGRVDYAAVLAALPPPAAWPSLARQLEARQDRDEPHRLETRLLRLVVAILQGDAEAVAALTLGLKESRASMTGARRSGLDYVFQSVLRGLEGAQGRDEEALKRFHQQLEAAPSSASQPYFQLQVPDLLRLEDAAAAEKDLLAAFASGAPLLFEAQGATATRARALALEKVATLGAAPWSLCTGPDSLELFLALDQRFPLVTAESPDTSDEAVQRRQQELSWRQKTWVPNLLAALVARRPEVVERLRGYLQEHGPEGTSSMFGYHGDSQLPQDGLDRIQRAGLQGELLGVLESLLDENPALSLGDEYADLGLALGAEARVVAHLEALRGRPGLLPSTARSLRTSLLKVHLASGQLDAARPLVQKDLGGDEAQLLDRDALQLALRWLQVGDLMGRPDIEAEGRAALVRSFDAAIRHQPGSASYQALLMADALELGGDPAAAEDVLTHAILVALKHEQPGYGTGTVSQAFQGLAALAGLYFRQARLGDALELLERSPDWGVRDLAEPIAHVGPRKLPLGAVAGACLVAAGRKAEARRVLEATLLLHPGSDPAYQSYVKLRGLEAVEYLDFLFARDRFEERPRIWKARVLLDAGRLDEAEAAVRQAIEIDPSDGDEGPDDRMRAYGVLADILEARKDTKGAAFFREVLAAIRLAERADRFYQVGLVGESLRLYEEALGHFGDAYCIRSRLGMRYAEIGASGKARVHLRRAFELMPSSFGYMESHCFGCEGIFKGPMAQSVAEEVLTEDRRDEARPPQVPYLLGYLREAQGRYEEARDLYLAAARQARDYLNAWSKLTSLQHRIDLPPEVLRDASVALARLDPAQRHISYGTLAGAGFAPLWEVAATMHRLSRKRPEALLSLVASRERLDLIASIQGPRPDPRRAYEGLGERDPFQIPSPGALLGRHPVLQVVGQGFQALKGQLRDE